MPKAKVSVTIDEALLRQCEKSGRGVGRSEMFEDALSRWLYDERRKRLEDEVEVYYASLSRADKRAEARWSESAHRFLGETWK